MIRFNSQLSDLPLIDSTSAMSLLYECINTVIAGEWFLLQISLLSFVGFHSFTCSLLNTENLGIELVYFLLVLFLYTFFLLPLSFYVFLTLLIIPFFTSGYSCTFFLIDENSTSSWNKYWSICIWKKNIVPAVIILEILVSHHLSDCQF